MQDAEQRLGTIYGFPVRIDPAFVHSRASRPTTRQFLIRLLSNLRLVYQGLRLPDPLLAIIRSVACCTMRFCSTLARALLVVVITSKSHSVLLQVGLSNLSCCVQELLSSCLSVAAWAFSLICHHQVSCMLLPSIGFCPYVLLARTCVRAVPCPISVPA